MNLIVMIAGREAVPVRAIPLLTSWENLSPDEVARALARDEGFENFADLVAYRLESGALRPIADVFWRNMVVREIEALEDRELEYPQWRQESIIALPAGSFVWRDELASCYLREYGWDANGEPAEPECALDFNPTVLPKFESVVMEGFDAPGIAIPVGFCEPALSFLNPSQGLAQTVTDVSTINSPLRMGHSTKDTRENDLTKVIQQVQATCKDRFSTAEVLAAVAALADSKDKPSVLLGSDEDGIRYRSGGEVKYLTREKLRGRLKYQKQASEKARIGVER